MSAQLKIDQSDSIFQGSLHARLQFHLLEYHATRQLIPPQSKLESHGFRQSNKYSESGDECEWQQEQEQTGPRPQS